jgi:photosystem II cytochrome c550
MTNRLFGCLFFSLVVCLGVLLLPSTPAQAAIDSYVTRYLHVTEPIALELSDRGETRSFTPEAISQGKQLFSNNCQACHVGGSTISFPEVSLSLEKLKAAMPSRDNINSLVAYMRKPMTYDGSEETYWCREVPQSWLTQAQVENIAAFILTAAQKAPGWGTETF